LEKLSPKLDLILSWTSALLGAAMLGIGLVQNTFQLEQVALVMLLASCAYLLCRQRLIGASSTIEAATFALNDRLVKCLNCLVFILFTAGVLIVNHQVYVRPLGFLIVTAAIAAIIAVIICSSEGDRIDYLALAEIFGLGLLLRASAFYQFPSLFAGDPNLHAAWIAQLAALGHLSDFMAGYQSFPLMHIASVIVMDISGLVVKDTLFVIGICDVISLFFIFLIVRHYFNAHIGMLALLLLMVSTWHITYDLLNIPQTFGMAFLNILIYLLFCKKGESIRRDIFYRGLAIMVLIAIVLTHTIDAFAALVILISIWGMVQLLRYIRDPEATDSPAPDIPFSLIIFLLIFEMAYWMYSAGFFMFFTDSIKWAFKVAELSPPVTTLTESFQTGALRWLPTYLNIFLALIGSFYLLKNRRGTIYFTMYGWGVLAFVFLSTFLNWYAFLPGRWFDYIEVVMIVPLAISFVCLTAVFRNRAIVLSLLIFIFAMLMVTNYNANVTNLIPLTPYPTISFKTSELDAARTLQAVAPDRRLYADIYYSVAFPKPALDGSQILQGKSPLRGILVLRREVEENVCFVAGESDHYDTVKLNYAPGPGDSEIYDSGTVQAIAR
jgi:hypothetical protein